MIVKLTYFKLISVIFTADRYPWEHEDCRHYRDRIVYHEFLLSFNRWIQGHNFTGCYQLRSKLFDMILKGAMF